MRVASCAAAGRVASSRTIFTGPSVTRPQAPPSERRRLRPAVPSAPAAGGARRPRRAPRTRRHPPDRGPAWRLGEAGHPEPCAQGRVPRHPIPNALWLARVPAAASRSRARHPSAAACRSRRRAGPFHARQVTVVRAHEPGARPFQYPHRAAAVLRARRTEPAIASSRRRSSDRRPGATQPSSQPAAARVMSRRSDQLIEAAGPAARSTRPPTSAPPTSARKCTW